ncbi:MULTISPECIES: tetratricopeptide repeat protein [unclassified Streptomyces]|uniref:tetratricopeptide repeat protein n=1 Tax=unclassified Streptomyces TaxID=2593676 RepID=UPI002E270BB1
MPEHDRIERARELYELAMFGGDTSALVTADHELDAVEAPLALERGKVLHVRFLSDRHENPQELVDFERAAELYHRLDDVRGEADALFWIGCWHQVVRDDSATGRPYFEKSYALARSVGDRKVMSFAARHLGFAEREAGRFDRARELLTESVTLRRDIGFMPGLAAGLVALAYLSAETNDRDAALRHLDDAQTTAEQCSAKAVLGWIEQARAQI